VRAGDAVADQGVTGHVPYKGGSEQIRAVISGEAKVLISNMSEALNAQVKTGTLRLLAMASEQPSTLTPSLPAIHQTLPAHHVGK
jgi:tripartite-type tricarboxylate transporter receptor subunit TctC